MEIMCHDTRDRMTNAFFSQPNSLDDLPIEPIHRDRLQWFLDHEGQIVPYSQLASITNPGLTSLPKGIYKPQGWEYSLSIKETLNSPYGDIPIATLANGDWVYRYHREDGNNKYTNIGLLNCLRDSIPVGVIIQVEPKPNVRYFVAGLGRLTQYSDPWFDVVNWRSLATDATLEKLVAEEVGVYDGEQNQAFLPGVFGSPENDKFSQQLIRPNQQMFRVMLLSTYQRTCAITQSQVTQVLDAAHIQPYAYEKIDKVHNGLLLRTDVHRLFDNGLIGVNPNHMEAVLSPRLIGSEYEDLAGRSVSLPDSQQFHPSADLLDEHRRKWNLN